MRYALKLTVGTFSFSILRLLFHAAVFVFYLFLRCFSVFISPFDFNDLKLLKEDGDKTFCKNGFLVNDLHPLRNRPQVNMNFYYCYTQLSGAGQSLNGDAKFTSVKSRGYSGYSLQYSACRGGGWGSILGQPVLDLWWTKLHWNSFSPTTSVFPCQYYSTRFPGSLFIPLPPTL